MLKKKDEKNPEIFGLFGTTRSVKAPSITHTHTTTLRYGIMVQRFGLSASNQKEEGVLAYFFQDLWYSVDK